MALTKYEPLEHRVYKIKNPSMKFYCPLCRTERAFIHRPHLEMRHYLQIAISSVVLTLAFYPIMGVRALTLVFFVWALFELSVRALFRKEVPCPHCGFDAAWYKRDVKVTRALVSEFWSKKSNEKSK